MSTKNEGVTLSAADVESFKNLAYRLGALTGRPIGEADRGTTAEDLLSLCSELADAGAPLLARDMAFAFVQGVEDVWNGEPGAPEVGGNG